MLKSLTNSIEAIYEHEGVTDRSLEPGGHGEDQGLEEKEQAQSWTGPHRPATPVPSTRRG